jgi:hypothetical protein
MGHFGKERKDDTYKWVVWQWANAKTKQKSPCIAMKRMNPESIEHVIKNYHLVMLKHGWNSRNNVHA